MKVSRAGLCAAVLVLSLTATACGEGGGDEQEKISVGIKFDQPGLGFKNADDTFSGFDVDVARYVAKELGYEPSQIEFKQVTSLDRELLLQYGEVDYVVASYSITEKRKAKVDFAGPYFTAHQDLMVRSGDKNIKEASDLNSKRLCSVTGSTSAQNVKEKLAPKAALMELGNYSECAVALKDTYLDAMTTDDSILAGFAAQKKYQGQFRLIGLNLSTENYGIGIKKGKTDLRDKINAALKKMVQDGAWTKAVETNFGPAAYKNDPAPSITG
ncbi:glutamate ABC transporter substrate-binding protein [Streptomyces bambusae]|uniref:glutamate ABC transporter substrate-binding protein n=1 Tax=Streptomyces bambusae TaxID=1550616 RepID=UPI001CFEB4E4|nr:glutamate ABC transporter substrate-binding protein [Streptomyces bambusae]MCB5167774.1 glutamate ABC transporter substrate-binding protein [Streptomyces bambusae]